MSTPTDNRYQRLTDDELFDEFRATINEARSSGQYVPGSKADLFAEVRRRWNLPVRRKFDTFGVDAASVRR